MSDQNDQNSRSDASNCLSEAEVRELAALSRLSPAQAQVDRLCTDLGAVLVYAECLAEAPLDGVEPMTRPVDETNKLDDDVPGETLDRSVLELIAPAFDGTFIEVPKVIDGGGES